MLRYQPRDGAIMEKYEIRVLTKKHTGEGANDHAAIRRALALANPTEGIVEVWCGPTCVFAGQLAEIHFSE